MAKLVEGDEGKSRFDPAKYLVNLKGRGEYLEVKWRLLWLRTEHPDAVVETECKRMEEREAVFFCRITIPGAGSATGWGSETAGDFRDFLEKAETKAIGRACAALGYGTQFCQDHDFAQGNFSPAPGAMRVVDAPVDLTSNRATRATFQQGQTGQFYSAGQQGGANDPGLQKATERQTKFIYAIAREAGLDEVELAEWVRELYNEDGVDKLNRRDASTLIEALQRRRNEQA